MKWLGKAISRFPRADSANVLGSQAFSLKQQLGLSYLGEYYTGYQPAGYVGSFIVEVTVSDGTARAGCRVGIEDSRQGLYRETQLRDWSAPVRSTVSASSRNSSR